MKIFGILFKVVKSCQNRAVPLHQNLNESAMSKEIKLWIENYSEIENLIDDLDLEFEAAF